MYDGWISPNFGPVGCLGAVISVVLIVAAVFGLLYMARSPALGK